jgi:hypothetical protein
MIDRLFNRELRLGPGLQTSVELANLPHGVLERQRSLRDSLSAILVLEEIIALYNAHILVFPFYKR